MDLINQLEVVFFISVIFILAMYYIIHNNKIIENEALYENTIIGGFLFNVFLDESYVVTHRFNKIKKAVRKNTKIC